MTQLLSFGTQQLSFTAARGQPGPGFQPLRQIADFNVGGRGRRVLDTHQDPHSRWRRAAAAAQSQEPGLQ